MEEYLNKILFWEELPRLEKEGPKTFALDSFHDSLLRTEIGSYRNDEVHAEGITFWTSNKLKYPYLSQIFGNISYAPNTCVLPNFFWKSPGEEIRQIYMANPAYFNQIYVLRNN